MILWLIVNQAQPLFNPYSLLNSHHLQFVDPQHLLKLNQFSMMKYQAIVKPLFINHTINPLLSPSS